MLTPHTLQVDQHEEYFATLRTRVEELRPLLQKVCYFALSLLHIKLGFVSVL